MMSSIKMMSSTKLESPTKAVSSKPVVQRPKESRKRDEDVVKCVLCAVTIVSSKLDTHMVLRHHRAPGQARLREEQGRAGSKGLQCPGAGCGLVFQSQDFLLVHFTSKHTGILTDTTTEEKKEVVEERKMVEKNKVVEERKVVETRKVVGVNKVEMKKVESLWVRRFRDYCTERRAVGPGTKGQGLELGGFLETRVQGGELEEAVTALQEVWPQVCACLLSLAS